MSKKIIGKDGNVYTVSTKEDIDNLVLSGIIGAATGSALLGGLLGGSYGGGILGDILNDDDGFGLEDFF